LGRRDVLRIGAGAGLAAALLPACKTAARVDATAIIVGSGFGGAVSALRLTKAGVKTMILERGRRWDIDNPPQVDDPFATNLAPDGRSYWLRDKTVAPVGPALEISKYVGVLERLDGNGMNVYAGAAYGGGSIPYGGITLQPSQARFERSFPSEITYAEMDAKYYPRVKAMLGASTPPDFITAADQYTYAKTFQAIATKAGMTTIPLPTATNWDILKQELAGTMVPSATRGELIYGNNTGSKLSLDQNYLKQAEATGLLDVRLQHVVSSVAIDSSQRYVVNVDLISETGDIQSSQTLTCKYLFLAAGSLGTTGLLLRSQASGGLSKLGDQVGQNWGPNGDQMFSLAGYTDPTGMMQGGPPVLGVDHYDNAVAPVYAELAQYPLGYETHSTLHLGVAMNKTLGQIVLDKDTGKHYATYPQSGFDEIKAVMMETINKLTAANPGIKLNTAVSADGFVSGFTYHPLGGASMGKVCDTYGRVNGYKGLYVVDAALMPGYAGGVNPSLTIAAISERALEDIVAHDLSS
jgi:cholesterol oxidase